MQRSPQLEQWARDLFSTNDPHVLSNAHSRDDAVTVIGTGPRCDVVRDFAGHVRHHR